MYLGHYTMPWLQLHVNRPISARYFGDFRENVGRGYTITGSNGVYAMGLRMNNAVYVALTSNAVVTPLRKAASYEQRKTNLGSSP